MGKMKRALGRSVNSSESVAKYNRYKGLEFGGVGRKSERVGVRLVRREGTEKTGLRGSSWADAHVNARAVCRGSLRPADRDYLLGFRLVRRAE